MKTTKKCGCAPVKSKRILDYILEWVEESKITIKKLVEDVAMLVNWKNSVSDEYIQNLLDAAVAEYDWSSVPEFDAKADKVEGATENNFAALDAEGNLKDSGKKASDFADKNHSHRLIEVTQQAGSSTISLGDEDQAASITIEITHPQLETKQAIVSYSNLGNLSRALQDPDTTPTEDSDKLITSGGVYAALQNAAPAVHSHDIIHSDQNEAYVETDQDGDIYIDAGESSLGHGVLYMRAGDKIVVEAAQQQAEINENNIANLNRALDNPDSTPTLNSTKLVTSGGVYTYLSTLEGRVDTKMTTPMSFSLNYRGTGSGKNFYISSVYISSFNAVIADMVSKSEFLRSRVVSICLRDTDDQEQGVAFGSIRILDYDSNTQSGHIVILLEGLKISAEIMTVWGIWQFSFTNVTNILDIVDHD